VVNQETSDAARIKRVENSPTLCQIVDVGSQSSADRRITGWSASLWLLVLSRASHRPWESGRGRETL